MTSNLRRAFNIVADRNNRGLLVACGMLSNVPFKYAIFELINNAGYVTEIWDDRSEVKVAEFMKPGDMAVLKILNNERAVWMPDYPESAADPTDSPATTLRPAGVPYPRRAPKPLPTKASTGGA